MLDLKRQNYVDWDVKPVFKLLDRENYAYRVVLKFQDGIQQVQQKSGFRTKKEAEDARKRTMGELSNGTYVVNSNVKLKEFLEYWLEYDIRQRVGSANTYSSYSRIVKKHIIPYLGRKKLIHNFWMQTISVVLIMESPAVRTFTGRIIKNCWKMLVCLISDGMT